MKLNMHKPITNLAELRAEKLRLQVLATKQKEIIQSDFEYIKKEYAFLNIMNRAAQKVVPEPVRKSTVLNDTVNFLARRVFQNEKNVVSTNSDSGKGNMVRNIALGAIEGVFTLIITRYLGRKIF